MGYVLHLNGIIYIINDKVHIKAYWCSHSFPFPEIIWSYLECESLCT